MKKLIPNLFDKCNYIVHYRNLKYYLKEGLILKKIHKVLSFKQMPWLNEYVSFNNERRKLVKNEFDKTFFKLLNNSFYGKTCENVRKRISVKTALTQSECRKHMASPSLDYFNPVNDNLVVFKMRKTNLLLNKPLYVGFTVLELSKLHMYQTYYDYFKKYYEERCELLYTDTDSLIMYIETEYVYKDLHTKFGDIMDTSQYPPSHFAFTRCNENKLGYFKDETKSKPIKEFCVLKPKMYSYIYGSQAKKLIRV